MYMYIYICIYHKRCLYFVVTTQYMKSSVMITCTFWAFLSKNEKNKTTFLEDCYSLNFVLVYHALENTFTYF